MKRAALALAALALVACSDGPTSDIVEFCIPTEQGPGNVPVARVVLNYERFSSESRPTLADTLRFLVATESPITVVDARHVVDTGSGDASIVALPEVSIAVTDASSDDPIVSRAAFWNVRALALDLPDLGVGSIGTFDGMIGGDLLRKYAVRMTFRTDPLCILPWLPAGTPPSNPSITFFTERPDSSEDLSNDGFGVIGYRLAGGGSTVVADEIHEFGATRIAISACVEPDPYDPTGLTDPERDIPVSGTDAVALVATGTRSMLLSRSFFERLSADRQTTDPGWPASGVQSAQVHLPEGAVAAERFDMIRIALVGDVSDGLSPCAELARRRQVDLARHLGFESDQFPLNGDGAAVLEVDQTRRRDGRRVPLLPAYVISDQTDLMSGLQIEVANHVPAIDLLIGVDYLSHFEVLIDYPQSRLVMRCMDYLAANAQGICPADAILSPANASCCETSGEDRGACRCAFSPCCQLYQHSKTK